MRRFKNQSKNGHINVIWRENGSDVTDIEINTFYSLPDALNAALKLQDEGKKYVLIRGKYNGAKFDINKETGFDNNRTLGI